MVFADPGHAAAKSLLADVFEQLGYGSENGTWRCEFLSAAMELRTGNFGTPTAAASADIVSHLSPDMLFGALAVQVDGPKAWNLDLAIRWDLPDHGASYRTTLHNGVLTYVKDSDRPVGLTLTVPAPALTALALQPGVTGAWSAVSCAGGHDGEPAAQGGQAVEPFDTTRPNIARVWDYWLGGKDNFAADRELAEKMLAVHPVTAQMARENRQFLGRAVSYVAARGVRQFIDVGAGLPTVLNTHDIARHTEPDARVAYVDNDPIVISHARSLLAKSPGVIAVPGDMRDPGRILADPGLTGLIDLAEPACVIISGVLHFVDPATARDIAGGFAQAIAPGSYLIISVGSGNPSEGENFTSAYTAARIYIHSRDEIQGFFGGLELVSPGVVSVRDWAGDGPALDLEPLTATFVAGVARKVNAN